MISFSNFTPQENPSSESPDLLNDESVSAEFDSFLNLLVVVPETNSMFSGAEIPKELNENPIGLQTSGNANVEIPLDGSAFENLLPGVFGKDAGAADGTSEVALGPNKDVSLPVTTSKFGDSTPTVQQSSAFGEVSSPEVSLPKVATLLNVANVPIPETNLATSKQTVVENPIASESPLTSPIITADVETGTQSTPSNPAASVFQKPVSQPLDPNSPGAQTTLQPFNESPQPDDPNNAIKQNTPRTDFTKTTANQPQRSSNIHNQALDGKIAEEMGFRILSTDEKSAGPGGLKTDTQNYSALISEKPGSSRSPKPLPKIAEIIKQANAPVNENIKSTNSADPTIDSGLPIADSEEVLIQKELSKPAIKSITETLDLETPKKQNTLPQTNTDLGAFAKEISSTKFEANLVAKSITDVHSREIAKQLETPLLDLASLESDSEEPNLLKFRLKPAELGLVEIRLEKNLAGKLEVHFQAESELAKQILAESFEHLRNSLQNAGWQIEQMEVSSSSVSSNGLESREDESRKNESTARNNSELVDETQESDEDLPQEDPNRLVSLRA